MVDRPSKSRARQPHTRGAPPRRASPDAERLRRALLHKVNSAQHAVTAHEAVLHTGLSTDASRAALLELAARYPCRITSDDDGRLRFTFSTLRRVRAPHPLSRLRRTALARLAPWRDTFLAFSTLLVFPVLGLVGVGGCVSLSAIATLATGWEQLVWTPIALLAATAAVAWAVPGLLVSVALSVVAFTLAMALGPVFIALLAAFGSPSSVGLAPMLVAAILMGLIGFPMIRALGPFLRDIYRDALDPDRAHWARTFWRAVGDFLLGPPTPAHDPLQHERDLVRWIHRQNGVLSQHDMLRLFGWDLVDSDSELVRILLRYDGDILVSEHGTVLYDFPAFRGPSRVRHAPPPPYWETLEHEHPPFFGTPNALTWFFTALVLVPASGAAAATRYGFDPFPALNTSFRPPPELAPRLAAVLGEQSAGWIQGLGLWPWLAVATVFSLRLPPWAFSRIRLHRARRRARIVRAAVESPTGSWIPVHTRDHRLLARLGGDIDAERGTRRLDGVETCYVWFPVIAQGVADAGELRDSPDASTFERLP